MNIKFGALATRARARNIDRSSLRAESSGRPCSTGFPHTPVVAIRHDVLTLFLHSGLPADSEYSVRRRRIQ